MSTYLMSPVSSLFSSLLRQSSSKLLMLHSKPHNKGSLVELPQR